MDRPGIRNDGAASPVPLIIQFAIGTLLVLYALGMSMPAFAQGEFIPRGQPIPESIRWQGAAGQHARMMGSFNARMFGLGTYHMVPVNYSTATLGKLAKGAIKRGLPVVGWGLTLKSLIEGAGWVMDELNGQITTVGTPQEPLGVGGWCRESYCATTPQGLTQYLISINYSGSDPTHGVFHDQGEWGGQAVGTIELFRGAQQVMLVPVAYRILPGQVWDGYINANPGEEPVAIDDSQVGNLIKGSEAVVNGISVDPQTGAPIRTTELIDAANALRRQLEAATGTDPATDLDPSTDYSESTPSQTEWPSFCSWAAKLCDWLYDTSPMEENPEVPHQQVEQQFEDYDSGFGGGSCPASSYVSVLDGEFEISWVGICGFVEYLRPLVIGLAWIVAAFAVVGGMRRS